MSTQLSEFPVARFNQMIRGYALSGLMPGHGPRVDSYGAFKTAYPVTTKADLRASVARMCEAGALPAGYVVATSGTSAAPTVSLWSASQTDRASAHALDLRRFIGKHLFARGDVVANLLAAGGFGSLYDGMNRVLEPLGVTIVPMGRFDAMPDHKQALDLLRAVRANTLVATPAGLIELARASLDAGCQLTVEKLVFIGERLTSARRAFLGSVWPGCRISGLYGTTEAGLIGVAPPGAPPDEYAVLSRWAFLERDEDGALLLTDLSAPLVPLLRYRVGDFVAPTSAKPGGGVTRLRLLDRMDRCFNLVGNLLHPDLFREAVRSCVPQLTHLQIQLSYAENGRERLHLAVDMGRRAMQAAQKHAIHQAIAQIPQVQEGLRRRVLDITVGGQETQHTNGRGKLPDLVDARNVAATGPDRVRVAS
ncbi:preprotein translocase subunit Tim44 [Roseobacter cerasinus]|uniref:Preprotein translocase subunit Tim44 n=1 Tax=Roseobacter cerasinus TaxID=2602289 RepID=A0A640VUB8_9RHOB|nr:AMP-binding protein [Roseobacter cerasinus]GFE51619.1 preprotein translocase subunit Tim44 [Roseobacter cerasinus]